MTPGMKHFLQSHFKMTPEELTQARLAEIAKKKRIKEREKAVDNSKAKG